MDYKCKYFDNFDALMEYNENLANKLLEVVGDDVWKDETIAMYDSLEDFAIYEVNEGYFACSGLDLSVSSTLNLADYIDYEALGCALSIRWDESVHCDIDGKVFTTSYGW